MDMNFIFSCSTRYRVDHSKIKFISTCGHVISSICVYLVFEVESLYRTIEMKVRLDYRQFLDSGLHSSPRKDGRGFGVGAQAPLCSRHEKLGYFCHKFLMKD